MKKSPLERVLNDRDILQPPKENLVQLISFTSQHNICTFDSNSYLKVSRTVMGTQMSSIMCNYLNGQPREESLKEQILGSTSTLHSV